MGDKYEFQRNVPEAIKKRQPPLGVIGTPAPSDASAIVFAGDCVFDSTSESGTNPCIGFPAIKGSPVSFLPGIVTATTPSTAFWWV